MKHRLHRCPLLLNGLWLITSNRPTSSMREGTSGDTPRFIRSKRTAQTVKAEVEQAPSERVAEAMQC